MTHCDDGFADTVDCANCGEPIDTGEWHPAGTLDDGGQLRIVSFCGGRCRQAWAKDTPCRPHGECSRC